MFRRLTLALILTAPVARAATVPIVVSLPELTFHVRTVLEYPGVIAAVQDFEFPVPVGIELRGSLDTETLLLSGITASTTAAGGFSATVAPFDVSRTIDPPGFEPPVTTTISNVQLSASWTFDPTFALTPQEVIAIDPGTMRTGLLRFGYTALGELTTHVLVDGSPVLELSSLDRMVRPAMSLLCGGTPAVPTCGVELFTFGVGPVIGETVLSRNIDDPGFGDLWQPELQGELSPLGGLAEVTIPGQIRLPEPSTALLFALALFGMWAHVCLGGARRSVRGG